MDVPESRATLNRSGENPSFLNDAIAETFGSSVSVASWSSVSGGTINEVRKLELTDGRSVLLKLAGEGRPDFQSEVDGLAAIAATGVFRVPEIFAAGASPKPFLIMQWVDVAPPRDVFWSRFGRRLAAMHRLAPADRSQKFGFGADNVIGETRQPNPLTESWATFFCQHRLAFQFQLASERGFFSDRDRVQFERFLTQTSEMIDSIPVKPSLIHGDLWSGNFLCDADQQPVLIDPAVSYSHDEAEFSIMKMFGGFDSKFYDAYDTIHPPLDVDGRSARVEIYSLYHYLNHLNIFGRSYLSDCWRVIKKYS